MHSPGPAGVPQDLAQWRKILRKELIARREAVLPAQRREWDLAISLHLLRSVPWQPGDVVGFCWPYRGEYDARHLLRGLRQQGLRCALPVIHPGPEHRMSFHHWEPGTAMAKGAMGIAYPVDTPRLEPAVLLVPLVGFGRAGDRLGYGGGYFDRSLAALQPRPLAVGVGYELCQVETTFPQPHDILLDAIVTERGPRWRDVGALVELPPVQVRERLQEIAQERAQAARLAAHTVPGLLPPRY